MESTSSRRHVRSRSGSEDSDEEYRRRRRRRETEDRDREIRSRDQDKRHEDRHRERRRSHSPTHDRHTSRRHDSSSRHKHRDRSPRRHDRRDSPKRKPVEDEDVQVHHKRSGPLPSQAAAFSGEKDGSTAIVRAEDKPEVEKQQPNFKPTGLLAAATNTVAKADGTSIVLKYHEPPEARKPAAKDPWRLFIFKGSEIVDTIELHLRSCWLIGRELAVVDLPAEHPSISKQHAVIQFRHIEKTNEYGDRIGKVRPYIIDLESANGTKLNGEEIPASRYLELRDKDLLQFGDSTREYVLMLPPKD